MSEILSREEFDTWRAQHPAVRCVPSEDAIATIEALADACSKLHASATAARNVGTLRLLRDKGWIE